jgi:hypothetical protein
LVRVKREVPRIDASRRKIQSIVLDFSPLFSSNPFGTRTHVLSNPSSMAQVKNKDVTVIKDQLCSTLVYWLEKSDKRNEPEYLNEVHQRLAWIEQAEAPPASKVKGIQPQSSRYDALKQIGNDPLLNFRVTRSGLDLIQRFELDVVFLGFKLVSQ